MDETPQIPTDPAPDPQLHIEEPPAAVPEAAQAAVADAPTPTGDVPPDAVA